MSFRPFIPSSFQIHVIWSAVPGAVLAILIASAGWARMNPRFLPLARLSSSASCRASYPRERGEPGERICLSQELWLEKLRGPSSPGEGGGGRWKAYSPPENTPNSRHPFQARKRIIRTFQAYDLGSSPPMPMPLRWVENAREKLSQALKPFDPSGTLRRLVLNEVPVERPSLDLVGRETLSSPLLDFYHWGTASGLHLAVAARILEVLVLFFFGSLKKGFGKTISIENSFVISRLLSAILWAWAFLLSGGRPGLLKAWALLSCKEGCRGFGLRFNRLSIFFVLACWTLAEALLSRETNFLYPTLYFLAWTGGLLAASTKTPSPSWITSFRFALGAWALPALIQCGIRGFFLPFEPIVSWAAFLFTAFFVYPLLLIGSFAAVFFKSEITWARPLGEGWLSLLSGIHRLNEITSFLKSVWVIGFPTLSFGAAVALASCYLNARQGPLRKEGNAFSRLFTICILCFLFRPFYSKAAELIQKRSIEIKVEQLDVGQGDAALIEDREPGGTLVGLIDSGSEKALSPMDWLILLSERGVSRIDWIALTHLDEDHAGGVRTLAKVLPLGCVETSREELNSDRGVRLTNSLLSQGIEVKEWDEGCVPYPVFAPSHRSNRSGKHRGNDSMGAILIPLPGGGAYLSMGDAEGEQEIAISKRVNAWARLGSQRLPGFMLHPLALKISHHGSRGSSKKPVFSELKPAIAVISDGIGNPYGHPSEEVLNRIENLKIPFFRTDELGSIDITQALVTQAHAKNRSEEEATPVDDEDIASHPGRRLIQKKLNGTGDIRRLANPP